MDVSLAGCTFSPALGRMPVTDLDQTDLKSVLGPIWHSKPEAARKALNRVGIVLRHAAAMGLDVDLQGRGEGQVAPRCTAA